MREGREKRHMTFFSVVTAAIEKILHHLLKIRVSTGASEALAAIQAPFSGFFSCLCVF